MRTEEQQPLSPEDARDYAAEVHATGGTVVFTNGVFDLLHPGHIRYLAEARSLGGVLVVGVNSDRSVKEIKGSSRPVIPQHERAEILLALSSVDAVAIFDEETPYALITLIQPDVLVKGADWGDEEIVGRDVVLARGGRVVRITFNPGHSTTELIRRAGR